MANSFQEELDIALKAVHRASVVTKDVMRGIQAFDKSDASPVTVADFAAQALIICAIHFFFPEDDFIAEESADMLRQDPRALGRVWELIASASDIEPDLPLPEDKEALMKLIDLGSTPAGPHSNRIWILDPIDGTAAFMKSQQYAVCLCLTVDGVQKVAALGCPNLRGDEARVEEDVTDNDGYGVVVYAVAGMGAFKSTLMRDSIGDKKIVKRPTDRTSTSDLQMIDSLKSSHADRLSHTRVYEMLGIQKAPIDIWSMQMRYIALAFGASDCMVRIPPQLTYRSCVWDHAGGLLIYEEAGGKIVDVYGQRFRFGRTRQFQDNCGYVAADEVVHDMVFKSVAEVLSLHQDS